VFRVRFRFRVRVLRRSCWLRFLFVLRRRDCLLVYRVRVRAMFKVGIRTLGLGYRVIRLGSGLE
jgi:hypothetical protein